MEGRYLIIPDIHGRTFWKDVCYDKTMTYDKIIFLGDYVDPYTHQKISEKAALDNFKEILKFSEENDNVVLLLGNHDIHYFDLFRNNYRVRFCYRIADEYQKLLSDNYDKFKIAEELRLNEKTILFTHAGVTNYWLECMRDEQPCRPFKKQKLSDYFPELIRKDIEPTAESLNTLLKDEYGLIALWMASENRGGIYNCGSPIWAHITEHFDRCINENIYQIFAHTLFYPEEFEPWITEKFAMIDSQEGYVLEFNTETDFFKLSRMKDYKNNHEPL